ncbi:FAD/NAD(P)-binding domain-containing protein [Aspergillus uvarum CBS 121591]|uniref:FAD/NAD(P)-binding domain-containing protein n=1 Tax=Aspergillus uvarum CBS 121591 TaxID=1448315 RepID=A0A319CLE9_9EURO|nr:FAD/NAD(P)-binding domain-containing protein [Aspergillus uvarum CBS 121591]PYH85289.1 FAD/NAD(P)-binding domain-containing protein [Aspergillus uvarum CBS 121591]
MPQDHQDPPQNHPQPPDLDHDLDALVVGTGFAGIYALHTLTQDGLRVQAIDQARDVGGTWYWNRYPGALSDTWSYLYRYSFDDELLRDYPAANRYSTQPEILDYLRHVVARYDLRRHMRFETVMEGAAWDDGAKRWREEEEVQYTYTVRYLVTALGLLNEPVIPNIPGLKEGVFQGEVVHTAAWDPKASLAGKRVGVIGVGSSGVQVVTAIASQVKSLHVFIRRPQYSVPANDRPLTPTERAAINASYPALWADVRASHIGMGFPESSRKFMAVSPADRARILETLWREGNGLQFMFGGFSDLTTDPAANEEVCRFLRRKIAEVVTDPRKAQVLTPKEPYARRPLSDAGYYEQFNRDHVHAVDVRAHPITEVVAQGLRTADGTLYELDTLIVATGFDALDGSYARVQIQGRNPAEALAQRWRRTGSACYLGCAVSGFPNLLIVSGPMAAFSNVPPLTETNVEFLRDLIRGAEAITRRTGTQCEIEATPAAERWWTEHCDVTARKTLFAQAPSWMFGGNVAGKRPVSLLYFGGLGPFRAKLAEIKAQGWVGFKEPLGTAGVLRSHL